MRKTKLKPPYDPCFPDFNFTPSFLTLTPHPPPQTAQGGCGTGSVLSSQQFLSATLSSSHFSPAPHRVLLTGCRPS